MSFFTAFDSSKTTRIHATSGTSHTCCLSSEARIPHGLLYVAQVFNVLKRVEHWPIWDVDLREVKFDTPAGTPLNETKGTLFMKNYGGGQHPFSIHNVDETSHFEYHTRLPGADAEWYWTWKQVDSGSVDMKMGVRVHGGSALLWRAALAPFLGTAIDTCLRNLKSLSEEGKVDGKDFSNLFT
ncbi:Aste57867_9418 [Aphanomyces stellatus]|uniref:Aste57867_9418 protein n=1 Tax=Aphanomyces stellatus TaxID=120398 RepID=A0A485KN95_9STRA|nr:hypothetical protein As57867_009382 [Aphanomyces stellatus]VFT86298.1 Aste57867_9418 [Aphanomyces stellatus]